MYQTIIPSVQVIGVMRKPLGKQLNMINQHIICDVNPENVPYASKPLMHELRQYKYHILRR